MARIAGSQGRSPAHRAPSASARRATALALCTLIAGCGAAADTQTPIPGTLTLGNGTVSGKRALATAQGTVDRPKAIRLRVDAAPRQRVTVVWALACPSASGGTASAGETGGSYVTTPPNVRPLQLPAQDVAQCAIDATARLARSGDVQITALADTR